MTRTISGVRQVFKNGRYELEEYSKTFDLNDPEVAARLETDPLKAEMFRIKAQCDERCKLMEAAKYFYYTIVDPAAINAGILRGAELALKFCSERLKIAWPMKIIWIEAESQQEAEYYKKYKVRDWEYLTMNSEILGKTRDYSDTIWLLKNLPFWKLVKVIAHECFHVLQSPSMPIPDREREAEGFADMFIQEFAGAV